MSEGCAGGLSKTGFVPEALLRDERALPPRELINNSGEVVGFSCPGPLGGCRALLWEDHIPTDLNALLPALIVMFQCTVSDLS